jgi:hypothetical protein
MGDQTPLSANDNHALPNVEMPALLDAQAQWQVMNDAWWRVNDALRLLRGQDDDEAEFLSDALTDLDALHVQMRRLQRSVDHLAESVRERHDASALKALTPSPQKETEVRARLAQADQNLNALYQHLQALCRQNAASLVQEIQQPIEGSAFPLHDAEVHVELDYLLDESNPLFDDQSNNILARQEPIFCSVTARGAKICTRPDDPEHDNWLDHKHPWMVHQGWLTHDVLEHNDGKNPRFGVAALLHTDTVWVEVHAVRSYAYDLRAGQFVVPETKK